VPATLRSWIPRPLRPVAGTLAALALAAALAVLTRPLEPSPPADEEPTDPVATETPAPRIEPARPGEPSAPAALRSTPPPAPGTAPSPPAPSNVERATLAPPAPSRPQPRAGRVQPLPVEARGPDPDVVADAGQAEGVDATAAGAGEVRGVWPTDPDGIRAAIGEAMPDLRECYAAWVQANPDLHGTIKARFTITPDDEGREGRVTDVVAADSTLEQPFLEGCVLNVLAGLRFEAPQGGPLTVSYPFVLSADR